MGFDERSKKFREFVDKSGKIKNIVKLYLDEKYSLEVNVILFAYIKSVSEILRTHLR